MRSQPVKREADQQQDAACTAKPGVAREHGSTSPRCSHQGKQHSRANPPIEAYDRSRRSPAGCGACNKNEDRADHGAAGGWRSGPDDAALERLTPHGLARSSSSSPSACSGANRPAYTLQPTALVNEAFEALVRMDAPVARPRTFLSRSSARLMRRILVNHAKARRALESAAGTTCASPSTKPPRRVSAVPMTTSSR